ncbi:hypothetical protein [Bradyrhizobium glycinis]|uniref:hypothetical protein n=1 Tax=Bradyrhizobium glycinis TaxID=2751812 RepID=UPI0018D711EC|nr:hypothetical protein [Bradyrhizobium glycinis]MBH5372028.1 hypothetical protein [Bradyrhizobium glycinis]
MLQMRPKGSAGIRSAVEDDGIEGNARAGPFIRRRNLARLFPANPHPHRDMFVGDQRVPAAASCSWTSVKSSGNKPDPTTARKAKRSGGASFKIDAIPLLAVSAKT